MRREPRKTPRGPSAIVLAAGTSSRFRGAKQLAALSGRPLVRRSVEAIPRVGVRETLVVVGFMAREIEEALGPGVRVVLNPRFRDGMSSSIRAGVQAVSRRAPGALIVLADQPFVTTRLLERLLVAFEARGGIVAAAQGELVSPPAVFSKRYFPELMALTGDKGARSVIDRHPSELTRVEVRSPRALLDIDTRGDLEAARRLLEH